MKGGLFRNRAKNAVKGVLYDEVNSQKGKLLNMPKVLLVSGISSAITLLLTFLGKEMLAFYLAIAIANPILGLIIPAIAAIVILSISIFIAERFFSRWLNSGPASDACTELLEEQIKQDRYESGYYERLTPGSKTSNTAVKELKKEIDKTYTARSESLGIDVEDAIANHSNPLSKFNNLCKRATTFLSFLPRAYLKSGTASEFTEEERHQLLAILKDHITMNDNGKIILNDNPNFIEGVYTNNKIEKIRENINKLLDFTHDTEISNDDGDLTTSQVIRLTMQAINILKVQKALKTGNMASFLNDARSNIPAEDLDKANKLLNILSPHYKPDADHRRLTDIYYIYADSEEFIPDTATCIEIYVLMNKAYNGQLRSQLTTDEVFHDMTIMLDFFDSATFKDVTLEETLNLVQCLEKLILLPVSGQQERTRHTLHSEQIRHNEEMHGGPLPGPAPNRRQNADDDTDGEREQPHL